MLFDHRWNGKHGIGRFSVNVLNIFQKYIPELQLIKTNSRKLGIIEQFEIPLKNNSSIFTPGFNAVKAYRQKYFLTIHDLMHIEHYNSSKLKYYYKYFVFPLIEKNKIVFTVSEYSKSVIKKYVTNKVKIVNCGNGIDSSKFQPPNLYIQKSNFLFLYNGKHHKNIDIVFKGLIEYKRRGGQETVVFVINNQDVKNQVKKLSETFKTEIIIKDSVSDDDLVSLYQKSKYLLMPSHYEGFGLPVIEALMCGTDVIISNKTSLPEITEKINKVIDVNDYVSLSDLLFQVPQPITNKIRNELSNRYSWEDVGLKILSEIA